MLHLDLIEIAGSGTVSLMLQLNEICGGLWREGVYFAYERGMNNWNWGEGCGLLLGNGHQQFILSGGCFPHWFGCGHVTVFRQWDISKYNANRGLKKHLWGLLSLAASIEPFHHHMKKPSWTNWRMRDYMEITWSKASSCPSHPGWVLKDLNESHYSPAAPD